MKSLSVTLGDFPTRFLKCSFHMFIRSSWLIAVSLALEVFFLLLSSFTVCHATWDSLSSTKFLILLMWPWMYYVCFFWYVLISSLCAFLSFWALALVVFLLLHRNAVFTFRFFLTANVSLRTLVGVLFQEGIDNVLIFVFWSVSDISWKSSKLFLSVMIYIYIYIYIYI